MKIYLFALVAALSVNITFANACYGEAQGHRTFDGGQVRSASCAIGRDKGDGFAPDGVYCSFAIEPVSPSRGLMVKPKVIVTTVFVTIRTDTGVVATHCPIRNQAKINSSFAPASITSQNLLPESFAPGQYELIVTVLAEADDGPPCLLDVYTSRFRIPEDRRGIRE